MSKETKPEVEEIDLLKLGQALLHRLWLLIICAVVGASIAFSYAWFFVTPLYEASALLYVNNNDINLGSTKVSITNGDLVAANSLIETYSVILSSRSTLEEVIRVGGLPYTYEQLRSMVSSSAVGNTAVFKITVTNRGAEMASHITNTILEVLPDRIAEVVEGSSVQIVDYSIPPAQPSSPSYKKFALIGAMAGLIISAAIVTLRFLLDTTIRSEDYLIETYKDIPVLAVIPDLSNENTGGYYYGYGRSANKAREVKK